jgi:hypothetical protein
VRSIFDHRSPGAALPQRNAIKAMTADIADGADDLNAPLPLFRDISAIRGQFRLMEMSGIVCGWHG